MSRFEERAALCLSRGSAGDLCKFDGDMGGVVTAPIYVQQVFDAVKFNLQGMKTSKGLRFSPSIPRGLRVRRVSGIRCRKYFNPENIDDPRNLTLNTETGISGAAFLRDCKGNYLSVVGADGTYSERIIYADTSECDGQGGCIPVFGTQTVSIYGNIIVELDLLLYDNCGCEHIFTVSAEVNIADKEQPMVLTNLFEICLPPAFDTVFLPRFTEFCASACEARLATNSCVRDINTGCGGEITASLIVAVCLTCEKKIVVPVQLSVLSTGYLDAPVQKNPVCTSFPSLFPGPARESCTGRRDDEGEYPCGEGSCKRPQPKR